MIRSRDRIQPITASCNPTGVLATPLFERLRARIEAMALPPGYSLSWGGEYEDSILGLIPLLTDVLFVTMSITIMAGLGFATVLTLFVVPVRYAILFRIRPG